MEEKELKVNVPEGYEIDKENSTFECIKFKPIFVDTLTYKEVCCAIIKPPFYYINNFGGISSVGKNDIHTQITDKNNAYCKKQLQKVLAINQLFNIAKYYNGDWEPDWQKDYNYKFYIIYTHHEQMYMVSYDTYLKCNVVYFKNKEDAQAVIDNPNFREILDTIFK